MLSKTTSRKSAFATNMVISHVFVTYISYILLAGYTTWFADHPEFLVLLNFLLHSFFEFVPLVYQRRSDRNVSNFLLFFCSHGHPG